MQKLGTLPVRPIYDGTARLLRLALVNVVDDRQRLSIGR